MYVVSIIPQEMAWEVAHPSVLLCGSRRKQLNKNTKPPYKKGSMNIRMKLALTG